MVTPPLMSEALKVKIKIMKLSFQRERNKKCATMYTHTYSTCHSQNLTTTVPQLTRPFVH